MRTEATLDVARLRSHYPSLKRTLDGLPCVFADAPGGTQTPQAVIEAITTYLAGSNTNSGGAFVTSHETDEVIGAARHAAADLVGCRADEVVFGPNMTTLAFALSRSLTRELSVEDEVIVTRLDHDANIAPWVAAARDAGASVRRVGFHPEDCTLDLEELEEALSPRTRIIAFPLASNAVGTVTAAREIVRRARSTRAVVVADAVHLAPHRALDVRSLEVDVLFCSPYKFFGPHLGIMFARRELLDELHPYKVRPAHDESPDRWETGTKNHEALAGLSAAVDYIAGIAADLGSRERRAAILASMEAVQRAEADLSQRFLRGLSSVPGARLYGISDPERTDERTPTFAVRLGDGHPRATAEELGKRGIFTWDGNYYALELMEALGLEATGGALRIGFCHYNTADEVERVVSELHRLAKR